MSSPVVIEVGLNENRDRAANLALGGQMRVGIGDHHYRERGEPRSAELVEAIAALARAFGREPATPAEARALLGLAPRARRVIG